MGLNIAAIIAKEKMSEQEISQLLGVSLSSSQEVGFEEAVSEYHPEKGISILQSEKGSLLFVPMEEYNLSAHKGEIVNMIIGDASDTYYFEKFLGGNSVRKFIYSQGEIYEDEGEGIVDENTDFTDLFFEICEEYLQTSDLENYSFKHYAG